MDIKHLIQTLDGIHSKEAPIMVDGKTLLNETSSGGSSAAGVIATIEASVAPPKAKSKIQRRVPADDKKPVKEDEINEEDLLVAPGVFKPQNGFTPRDRVRTDHEVGMAVSDLIQCAKNAETIHNILSGISEQQGLPGWVQEKITKAADYLNTVAEYMEGEHHQHNAGIAEASSPAQQAAIAVNMKKQGKKPKTTKEDVAEETITEKAKSKQQQKFFGMVHAIQKGEKVKGASKELKAAAKSISKGDVTDFAKTKHKGLPTKKKAKKKVDESLQAIEQRLDETWKKWSGS